MVEVASVELAASAELVEIAVAVAFAVPVVPAK